MPKSRKMRLNSCPAVLAHLVGSSLVADYSTWLLKLTQYQALNYAGFSQRTVGGPHSRSVVCRGAHLSLPMYMSRLAKNLLPPTTVPVTPGVAITSSKQKRHLGSIKAKLWIQVLVTMAAGYCVHRTPVLQIRSEPSLEGQRCV